MLVGKHIEGTGRSEPHGMMVMGTDEGVERDKAVAARTILHHYRLAPARGQTIRLLWDDGHQLFIRASQKITQMQLVSGTTDIAVRVDKGAKHFSTPRCPG